MDKNARLAAKFRQQIETDVKRWLKTCRLDPMLSTPLDILTQTYTVQDGRYGGETMREVVTQSCPGLRISTIRGKVIVHGIAPNWL